MSGPFGNCKQAKIHLIQQIQEYAILIALNDNRIIKHHSENINLLSESITKKIINTHYQDQLPILKEKYHILSSTLPGTHQAVELDDWHAYSHFHNKLLIIELEPKEDDAPTQSNEQQTRLNILEQFRKTKSITEVERVTTLSISQLTGFDRVMLYKFHDDWHGEVVHEVLQPGVQGFEGLHFPAADIPPNARRLYTLNWQRQIADVNSPTINLVSDEATPIDLTYAFSRAAHPVHIQYLKNMNVEASFSVSLIVDGKLWGMVACHHLAPHRLSMQCRLRCEEIARLASLEIQRLQQIDQLRTYMHLREGLTQWKEKLHQEQEQVEHSLAGSLGQVKQLLDAEYVLLNLNGVYYCHPSDKIPATKDLIRINLWLNHLPVKEASYLNQVDGNSPLAENNIAGIIYLPLGLNNYILATRPEWSHQVNWAGKPQSQEEHDESSAALTPRSSFASWSETVHHQAKPWLESTKKIANDIRLETLEYLNQCQINTIAHRDALTGLHNRLSFEKRLEKAIKDSMLRQQDFSLLLLDLDKFKPVNDNFGHPAGDFVLKETSKRLKALTRQQDTVARLGGDEFAIIQTNISNAQSPLTLAKRIINAIQDEYNYNDKTIHIGVSIGVAISPNTDTSQDKILEQADQALYQVKKAGRNGYALFQDSKDNNPNLHQEILAAIEQDNFIPAYQPIKDNLSPPAFKIYCRWSRENELIEAKQFWSTLKNLHLSAKVCEQTLRHTFADIGIWKNQGLIVPRLHFTLCREQLQFDLANQLSRLEQEHGTGLEWLRINIKEHDLLEDLTLSELRMAQLKQLGISLYLEDFGHSPVPLDKLSRLNLSGLYLDGHTYLPTIFGLQEQASLKMVMGISHSLGLRPIFSHIENEEQLALLQPYQPVGVQGYLIGPVTGVRDITQHLKSITS